MLFSHKGFNMREFLMGKTRLVPKFEPGETGPGSDTFVGFDVYDNSGFFGEVSGEEFITPLELSNLMTFDLGEIVNPNVSWLKFYLDGKILYYPKKSIRSHVSYLMLEDAELILGNRTVQIKDYNFRIRLIRSLSKEDPIIVNSYFDNIHTMRSEWNRLMYRVTQPNPEYTRKYQTGPNWFNYPEDDSENGLALISPPSPNYIDGAVIWVMENMQFESKLMNLHRGLNGVTYMGSSSLTNQLYYFGWRPVLELIKV